MSTRPTACVANLDGIDFCVAENVRRFYGRLGFQPLMTRMVVPADVLVILRGCVSEIDCSAFQDVHVFNYVGQDRSKMRLRNVRSIRFVEWGGSLARWRPIVDCEPSQVVHGRHPVYPELWITELKEVRYPCSHIGNFKWLSRGEISDPCQKAMVDYINRTRVPVWGRRWEGNIDPPLIKGSVSLWKVPRLFAQTQVSLGLRYPEQRVHRLISSRYWLGPLNGCPILSDEEQTGDEIPGVFYRGYGDAAEFSISGEERRALVGEANAFWEKETRRLEDTLREGLAMIEASGIGAERHRSVRVKYWAEVMARKVKSAIE